MIFYLLGIELSFDPCRILSDSTSVYPEHTGMLNVQCNFFSLLLFQTQSFFHRMHIKFIGIILFLNNCSFNNLCLTKVLNLCFWNQHHIHVNYSFKMIWSILKNCGRLKKIQNWLKCVQKRLIWPKCFTNQNSSYACSLIF